MTNKQAPYKLESNTSCKICRATAFRTDEECAKCPVEHPVALCPCGSPQSYPIPHEHDQTDREKQIIAHYEATPNPVIVQLKKELAEARENELTAGGLGHRERREWWVGYQEALRRAIEIVVKVK